MRQNRTAAANKLRQQRCSACVARHFIARKRVKELPGGIRPDGRTDSSYGFVHTAGLSFAHCATGSALGFHFLHLSIFLFFLRGTFTYLSPLFFFHTYLLLAVLAL